MSPFEPRRGILTSQGRNTYQWGSQNLNLQTIICLFTVLCMITCHKWPPPSPQGLSSVWGWRAIYGEVFGHFREWLSFPWHLLSMQKVYMFIKLLSPDNLCLMMEKEGSTKNLEGEREIYFLLIYMQRNNTQQWKGMKHQPLKGINLRCTWLSERIQLKRLHPVWRHCDILGKVKLHRW